jgi:hypothetical protein
MRAPAPVFYNLPSWPSPFATPGLFYVPGFDTAFPHATAGAVPPNPHHPYPQTVHPHPHTPFDQRQFYFHSPQFYAEASSLRPANAGAMLLGGHQVPSTISSAPAMIHNNINEQQRHLMHMHYAGFPPAFAAGHSAFSPQIASQPPPPPPPMSLATAAGLTSPLGTTPFHEHAYAHAHAQAQGLDPFASFKVSQPLAPSTQKEKEQQQSFASARPSSSHTHHSHAQESTKHGDSHRTALSQPRTRRPSSELPPHPHKRCVSCGTNRCALVLGLPLGR